jgi:hypothetical protein
VKLLVHGLGASITEDRIFCASGTVTASVARDGNRGPLGTIGVLWTSLRVGRVRWIEVSQRANCGVDRARRAIHAIRTTVDHCGLTGTIMATRVLVTFLFTSCTSVGARGAGKGFSGAL